MRSSSDPIQELSGKFGPSTLLLSDSNKRFFDRLAFRIYEFVNIVESATFVWFQIRINKSY